MSKSSVNALKRKIHLIISVIVVIPVAFIYGFNIESTLEISPITTDEFNLLKAVMGIYLGFAFLWLIGLLKNRYLKVALVSNMIFMLGLGFGRLISFAFDGLPSMAFIVGTAGELTLGFYGVWVLTNKNLNFAEK